MEHNNLFAITCKEIRRKSRLSLKGNWGIAALITLVLGSISFLFSAPSSFFSIRSASIGVEYTPGFIDYIVPVLSIVVMSPLSLGFYSFFLKISRNEKADFGELFSKFSVAIKSIGLFLLIGIKTFLWTLLFIIPGIIASLRYSMAPFILLDNPDMTITEAINESKKIMIGNKGKLFLLGLSFIGWAVLCIFTLGIGVLWLSPYMETSYSHFYNILVGKELNVEQ